MDGKTKTKNYLDRKLGKATNISVVYLSPMQTNKTWKDTKSRLYGGCGKTVQPKFATWSLKLCVTWHYHVASIWKCGPSAESASWCNNHIWWFVQIPRYPYLFYPNSKHHFTHWLLELHLWSEFECCHSMDWQFDSTFHHQWQCSPRVYHLQPYSGSADAYSMVFLFLCQHW